MPVIDVLAEHSLANQIRSLIDHSVRTHKEGFEVRGKGEGRPPSSGTPCDSSNSEESCKAVAPSIPFPPILHFSCLPPIQRPSTCRPVKLSR
ncbi:hypothetical protein ARMSODRAFT_602570 [Armillaria solidipes]|uniref:Uncharacterized protein n=1 Tax=Armillaria solidipes TaxID=1076256 RepID=A0A2H3B8Z4_9AGAR|nr:hypothetical protein ARMSODRAFT_602570 [Armillaria solidipes]